MDDYTAHNVDDDTELGKIYTHEGDTSDAKDTGEIESIMELLTRVDLDLAYSSEKLANLDTLLMHVMASENALEAISVESDNSSEDLMEKALLFDLLSAILDSEVRDLDNFMRTLQAVIVDAHQKITSCRHLRELFIVMEVKLHDSEESLKKSKEEVFEIKMHLSKLQRSLFNFIHNDWKYDSLMGLSENGQVANVVMKPKLQTVDQQRHILRMLEKSLGRELHLEKKLTESKQNEEDLKLKVRLTEQVALCMEEAAEVVWGRFLEAENAAEVLMGTSKELVGRLQIVQFNLNGSCQREDEAKSKLFVCLEELKSRENTFKKLESRISELIAENSEVCALRKRVKLLEEQLKKSEFQLKNANASIEANQEQLREMDHMVDSLKENIYIAESRADTAESKITRLTDTNVELTEELGFLKNNNDSDTKKVSLLEKQLRELEIQLQHARASSEASQEQQNMLYSAIWDMETLIEELKSKVSKADIKAENAEEQCVVLTETNLELNNELSFMRTRIESLETSLQQAEGAKATIAKDINVKTKFIMDMVMQLAIERERVKKQLYSLTVENKILVEKFQKTKGDKFASLHENLGADYDKFLSSKHDSSNATSTKPFEEATTESLSRNFQVDISPKDASACVTDVESSVSANDATNMVPELEADGTVEEGQHNRMCIFMAFIVLLLSVLASYMFNKKPLLSDAFDG